jgi:hypothetical protein
MDEAEPDVLAYMSFPSQHRAKLHSTNPIERLNGEIKRRTEVVGIFPNEDAIVRLIGAILLEQNDEWAVQRARYMTLETIAPLSDDPIVACPPWQADAFRPVAKSAVTCRQLHHASGHDRRFAKGSGETSGHRSGRPFLSYIFLVGSHPVRLLFAAQWLSGRQLRNHGPESDTQSLTPRALFLLVVVRRSSSRVFFGAIRKR